MSLIKEFYLGNTKVKIMDDYIVSKEEASKIISRINKLAYEIYKENAVNELNEEKNKTV